MPDSDADRVAEEDPQADLFSAPSSAY